MLSNEPSTSAWCCGIDIWGLSTALQVLRSVRISKASQWYSSRENRGTDSGGGIARTPNPSTLRVTSVCLLDSFMRTSFHQICNRKHWLTPGRSGWGEVLNKDCLHQREVAVRSQRSYEKWSHNTRLFRSLKYPNCALILRRLWW